MQIRKFTRIALLQIRGWFAEVIVCDEFKLQTIFRKKQGAASTGIRSYFDYINTFADRV